jgi:hypothetical protein
MDNLLIQMSIGIILAIIVLYGTWRLAKMKAKMKTDSSWDITPLIPPPPPPPRQWYPPPMPPVKPPKEETSTAKAFPYRFEIGDISSESSVISSVSSYDEDFGINGPTGLLGCRFCNGTGLINGKQCKQCEGTGLMNISTGLIARGSKRPKRSKTIINEKLGNRKLDI